MYLYFDIPIFEFDLLGVVWATYVSASLHNNNPIVSLSTLVFSKSSIAFT